MTISPSRQTAETIVHDGTGTSLRTVNGNAPTAAWAAVDRIDGGLPEVAGPVRAPR